jgi:hypothetical protein
MWFTNPMTFWTTALTPNSPREAHQSREAAEERATFIATHYSVEVDVYAADYSYEATVTPDGTLEVRS